MIADNLHDIQQEIQESCALVSRDASAVTLVAVTKSVEADQARELVELGVTNVAENRVDKLLAKKAALADHDLTWHLIGNLQRRKVKQIINEIDYFHALDSLRLAEEIEKRAARPIKCFIEVNVSGEESKHGITPQALPELIAALQTLEKIKIVGLMTMAPLHAAEAEIRDVFHRLKTLQQTTQKQVATCTELSMGMSHDFKLAIEEGATFVRIGTALFKER
ncbi:YggS family pyridoxal phosphate-dependent enzyme [Enterococcus sp. CSURQ0835]|uniref:YggS family pyridoxal phosphate-dependent enzyme n=1 Tax=Enterococcus sp. CSURQ0835 TaxID=2681394 RepID=UPI00135CBCB7|nr:YggS family pyridoxal phosphate-dependent enzyme [Enterococcus sp. CSURQ0835]